MRKFGPKSKDHPSVGNPCPICGKALQEGDYTTLIAIGPDDAENQAKCDAGKPYTSLAAEVHYECV